MNRRYARIPKSRSEFGFLDPGGLAVRETFECTIEDFPRDSFDRRCKYVVVRCTSEDARASLDRTHRLAAMHCSVAFGKTPDVMPWDPETSELKLKIPLRSGRCQTAFACEDGSLTTYESVVPGRRARADAKFAGAWKKDDGAVGYTWVCESMIVEGAGTFS